MNYSPDELELLKTFYELIEIIKEGASFQDQMELLVKNPEILNDSNRELLRKIATEPKHIDNLLDKLKERYRIFNESIIKAAAELYKSNDDPKERILPAIMLFENAKTIDERRKIIIEGGLLLEEAEAIIDSWLDVTRKNEEKNSGKNNLKAVELLKYHRQAMAMPLKSQDFNALQSLLSPLKHELFHQPGTVLDVVPAAVKICSQIASEITNFIDKSISFETTKNLYDKLKTFINQIGELEVVAWDSTVIDQGVIGVVKIDNNENCQYPSIKIRKTQFATYLLAHELSHSLVHLDNCDLYDGHNYNAKYDEEKDDFLFEIDQMFQYRIGKVAESGSRYFIEELIADTIASFIVLPKSFPLKTMLSRFGPPLWGYPGVRVLHKTASYSVVKDAVDETAQKIGAELNENDIRKYIQNAEEDTVNMVSEHIQTVKRYSEKSEISAADIEIAYMWLAFLNRYTKGKVQNTI